MGSFHSRFIELALAFALYRMAWSGTFGYTRPEVLVVIKCLEGCVYDNASWIGRIA